jgi:hypothetical protein
VVTVTERYVEGSRPGGTWSEGNQLITSTLVDVPGQQAALAALSEGFCPQCACPLGRGGTAGHWCACCGVYWFARTREATHSEQP